MLLSERAKEDLIQAEAEQGTMRGALGFEREVGRRSTAGAQREHGPQGGDEPSAFRDPLSLVPNVQWEMRP